MTKDQEKELIMDVACHLFEMKQMFVPEAELTLIVRNPSMPDADLIFTRDDYDKVVESIERMKVAKAQAAAEKTGTSILGVDFEGGHGYRNGPMCVCGHERVAHFEFGCGCETARDVSCECRGFVGITQ